MDIYIKWNNDENSLLLPINPESYDISGTMNNTTVNIHNLGDVLLKGKRGLYDFSISSFLPAEKYSFAKGTFKSPNSIISKIKKLYESNETVHVIVTGTDINGFFSIENFNKGHHDKTNDLFYTLSLKEFRETGSSKRVTKTKPKTISYTWKKGDTWQRLAKSKLGSSAKWKTLRNKNKTVINKAKKNYKKKHPKIKKINESTALIGFKVIISA